MEETKKERKTCENLGYIDDLYSTQREYSQYNCGSQ